MIEIFRNNDNIIKGDKIMSEQKQTVASLVEKARQKGEQWSISLTNPNQIIIGSNLTEAFRLMQLL